MNNVTDICDAGPDADVLTETDGGLLGRALLEEGPLSSHVGDDETPRYVLRNKSGLTVERPDDTETISPVGRYSGLALVSDERLLFAVGGRGGDRTLSVSLVDVVDVRFLDGRPGGLVVETAADARYEFPCKGDLDPVREFLDAAVGVWTRADRRIERAESRLGDLRAAFESGDADVVLAAIGDVREKLAAAREEADALGGAREHVAERADAVEADLAALERRAYAEQAEQARERAHVRWDDHEYGEAYDHLEDADDAYAAAADIDADRPSDDLLERRRETLADERARLAAAPLDRAEHAADVAGAAEDPGAAVDWWSTTVERFETVLSLDWGRDDRRFEGDPGEVRDELATAATNLVAAYCDLAREHIEDGDDDRETNPEAARAAYDLAAEALADGREVARERVPGATGEIDDVAETLEECLARLPSTEDSAGAEVDGGRAASKQTVIKRPDGPDGPVSPDDEDGEVVADLDEDEREEGNEEDVDLVDEEDEGVDEDLVDEEDEGGDVDLDDEKDESGNLDGAAGHATTGTETADDSGAPAGGPVDLGDGEEPADLETRIDSDDADPADGDEVATGNSEASTASTDPERSDADETADGDPTGTSDVAATPGATDDAGTAIEDPRAVDPDRLPELVESVFWNAGWKTTLVESGTDHGYDLLVETVDPVQLTACVWTIHPDEVETVREAHVEQYAAYLEHSTSGDAAVICSAAPFSPAARNRADDRGVRLLGPEALVDRFTAHDVIPTGD